MNILLVTGGWTQERQVALNESARIQNALVACGHQVSVLDTGTDFGRIIPEAAKADFAYLCMQDGDGALQAMLERIPCPFQGSRAAGVALAGNKTACKLLFSNQGIATAPWELHSAMPENGWRPHFPFPVVAKPNTGGSSIGISIVSEESQLRPAMEIIFRLGKQALIEPYLDGPEISCAVLGDTALPPILIIPKGSGCFFDFCCKYTPGMADEICPAPIDDALARTIQDLAVKANDAIGLSGFSRSDFIVHKGIPHILEINSQPGMTPNSLFPKAALAAGISLESLVDRLIDFGIRDFRAAR